MSNQEDDTADGAEVVDFDALNAALGAIPPAPPSSSPMIAASEGRSAATYASARPHKIPASFAPNVDLNAPAVIVLADETIPTGPPPQMTTPMGPGVHGPHPAPGMSPDATQPPTGHPYTPPPFQVSGPPSDSANATLPMPAMPALRRPRHPTLVLPKPPKGPTRAKKIAVFMSMLVVFVGAGGAFLVLYKPAGISIDLKTLSVTTSPTQARPTATFVPSAPSPTVSVVSVAALDSAPPTATTSAPVATSSTSIPPSALPSASAVPVKKPKPRPQAAPAPTIPPTPF